MSKRVARQGKRRSEKPRKKNKRKQIAIICSLLILTLAVGVMAQWKILPGSSKPLTLAPAPVQTGSFAVNSPSKEYIYAGNRLIATEEPLGTASSTPTPTPSSSTENVVWTNRVKASASSNNLSKPSSYGYSWDSGAVSTKAIASGNGYVEFSTSEYGTFKMAGLSQGDSNQDYVDIDFAFYMDSSGNLFVYEKGVNKQQVGTYGIGANERLRIAVESNQVKFYKNGSLLYTSSTAPTYPLLLDTSLYSPNATISGAVISGSLQTIYPPVEDVVWTNLYGTSVSGTVLTKTSGPSWYNASANSTRSIASGNGFLEFTAQENDSYRMCGLTNGNSTIYYSDIDYAIYLQPSVFGIFESGVHVKDIGAYSAGDRFRVSVEGGVVKYWRNGTIVHTSTVAPSYPLVVDTSFYSQNSTIKDAVLSGTLTP